MVTGAHRNDGALLDAVLADIRVPRLGAGRPRTRPGMVLADKAYSAGVYRRALHARGITVVIPEKSDQIAARKRRGSRGGRPPGLDTAAYRDRIAVEGRIGSSMDEGAAGVGCTSEAGHSPVACAGGVRTSAPGAGELNAWSAS